MLYKVEVDVNGIFDDKIGSDIMGYLDLLSDETMKAR